MAFSLCRKLVMAIAPLAVILTGGNRGLGPVWADDSKEAIKTSRVVRIPCQHDGLLLFIGTEIKPGESIPANRLIMVKIGDQVQKYRRLEPGDRVEEGQLLGRVDDRLVRDDVAIRVAKLASIQADYLGVVKTCDEARLRFDTVQRMANGGVSLEEVQATKLLCDRARAECLSRNQAIKVAELELKQARTILEQHEIRSRVRGVIETIPVYPGEAIRRLETPVLLIRLAEER